VNTLTSNRTMAHREPGHESQGEQLSVSHLCSAVNATTDMVCFHWMLLSRVRVGVGRCGRRTCQTPCHNHLHIFTALFRYLIPILRLYGCPIANGWTNWACSHRNINICFPNAELKTSAYFGMIVTNLEYSCQDKHGYISS
jgi:hypothetical protein